MHALGEQTGQYYKPTAGPECDVVETAKMDSNSQVYFVSRGGAGAAVAGSIMVTLADGLSKQANQVNIVHQL